MNKHSPGPWRIARTGDDDTSDLPNAKENAVAVQSIPALFELLKSAEDLCNGYGDETALQIGQRIIAMQKLTRKIRSQLNQSVTAEVVTQHRQ